MPGQSATTDTSHSDGPGPLVAYSTVRNSPVVTLLQLDPLALDCPLLTRQMQLKRPVSYVADTRKRTADKGGPAPLEPASPDQGSSHAP